MARVAINGFGRIGRYVTHLAENSERVEIALIMDPMPARTAAYLLSHDSAQDRSGLSVQERDGGIVVNGHYIPFASVTNPFEADLAKHQIDIVLESSGIYRNRASLIGFIEAGAKRVVTTYPLNSDADITILPQINECALSPAHIIISAGTCTAHGLAPVLSLLHEHHRILSGSMLTVHGYTSNQSIVDSSHPRELRKGRAAAGNIVPVSTVAIGVIEKVMPDLRGKLTGYSLRVPVIVGSLLDLSLNVERPATAEGINRMFEEASSGKFSRLIQVRSDEPVSSDIVGSPASAIIDTHLTRVVNGHFVKVSFWYDNEAGFSNRIVELLGRV